MQVNIPPEYLSDININGMSGRVLSVPATSNKKSKILFIYGHHSSLERWWGLMQALSHYGEVVMPDLPGFGGMDSFYKIHKKPEIDNFAEYLKAYIKKHFGNDEIVIAGMSFGFVVATRMLQKYPEMKNQIKLVISIVGFSDASDFTLKPIRKFVYINASRILELKPVSLFFRYVALHPFFLNTFYGRTHNAKHKYKEAKSREEIDAIKAMEVRLWHDNDPRTWSYTTVAILTLKQNQTQIDLPVWHVGVSDDHFFDHQIVERNLAKIYRNVVHIKIDAKMHAPSVIADEKAADNMLPNELKKRLADI